MKTGTTHFASFGGKADSPLLGAKSKPGPLGPDFFLLKTSLFINELIRAQTPVVDLNSIVKCRERLGGTLNYYYLEALDHVVRVLVQDGRHRRLQCLRVRH